jgi:exopolysaccharide production protein ExoQ
VIEARLDPLFATPPFEKRGSAVRPAKPSRWIWVPYVWLFFASTRTLSSWLTGGVGVLGDLESGSPADRMLMSLLICLGLFVLWSRAEQTKRILANNKWLVLLSVYIALSILWSNFPSISLRRGIRSVGTFVMVLVVLTERNPTEAVRALLRRLYFVHIPLSIIAIKYVRNIGVMYNWSGVEEEWTGISIDKNSLGQVAMCSGLFSLWQILKDWPEKKSKRDWKKLAVPVLLLILSLWLLRGSKNVHSSAAILGFIICSVILFGLQYIKKRAHRAKRIILTQALAFSLLGPIVYFVFQTFNTTPVEMMVQATGRNMTFTDRTLLWTDILNNTAKNPVLGVGIGAFWVGPIGYEMYPLPNWSRKTPQWRPEEGHNGYIDVYAELGAIGLVLLLIVIGRAIAGVFSDLQNEFQLGSLRLVLLLSVLMNNIAETTFLSGTHGLWFLFLLTVVNLPRPKAALRPKKTGVVVDCSSNHYEPLIGGNALRPFIGLFGADCYFRSPSSSRVTI